MAVLRESKVLGHNKCAGRASRTFVVLILIGSLLDRTQKPLNVGKIAGNFENWRKTELGHNLVRHKLRIKSANARFMLSK